MPLAPPAVVSETTAEPTLLLIRHAAVDGGEDVLWGRTPGVRLSRDGRREALRLAQLLAHRGIRQIVTSPQRRAIETAAVIASAANAALRVDDRLDEFDFGEWTGRGFTELEHDARWQRFNHERTAAVAPGGESVASFAARVKDGLASAAAADGEPVVAIVTHAEVIRTALLVHAGRSLDEWASIRIDPASVAELRPDDGEFRGATGADEASAMFRTLSAPPEPTRRGVPG